MSRGKNQYEALTEQQIQFCEHYLDLNNGTAAAIKAKYSEQTAASQASRLLKNVKIKEYIDSLRTERREAIMNKLSHYAIEAVAQLYDLAMNAENETVKLNATKDILDRSGYKPVEKKESTNTLNGKIEFGFVDPNEDN